MEERISMPVLMFRRVKNDQAQITMEFTFSMIIVLIMFYSIIQIIRWVGVDLVERRIAHDSVLTNDTISPREQIDPYFYEPKKLDTSFK